MRRREFIAGFAGAAVVGPLQATAQHRSSPARIGILNGFSNGQYDDLRMKPFRQELQALGWIEGRTIVIEHHQVTTPANWMQPHDLVATKPDVILVLPTPAMQAIWRATRSIPVVFGNVSDPVEGGFVASMARPDGNATGFTSFEYSLGGKWLEVLKEYVPGTARALVLLVEENYTSRGLLRSIEAAGRSLGVKVVPAPVRSAADVELAMKRFADEGGGGLLTPPHPVITNNTARIVELAQAHRLPGVYPFRSFAVEGGVVAYGTVEADVYRRAAGYVDRILKGTKPGELPVQNPVKFELVVNLKTARAMQLAIPASFLIRADEVIGMKRRDFIALLGGAAATLPFATQAQPSMPVIGWLSSLAAGPFAPFVDAFRQGLKEGGFVEGQNVAIEYRWAEGQFDKLPGLAAELVRRPVTVIATAGGLVAAEAGQAATSTIPILFAQADDPVATGLVKSLNRPGGNITGVSWQGGALRAKNLELLHEFVPSVTTVGVLFNPNNPSFEVHQKDVQEAAGALGKKLQILRASTRAEIDRAFTALVNDKTGALIVGTDPVFANQREHLVMLAARHAIPTVYFLRAFTADGGLMSYGSSLSDAYRLLGSYTARVLKGEKPADLPVQLSTKIELVINLKTAKSLGMTFPNTLLARADEVIE